MKDYKEPRRTWVQYSSPLQHLQDISSQFGQSRTASSPSLVVVSLVSSFRSATLERERKRRRQAAHSRTALVASVVVNLANCCTYSSVFLYTLHRTKHFRQQESATNTQESTYMVSGASLSLFSSKYFTSEMSKHPALLNSFTRSTSLECPKSYKPRRTSPWPSLSSDASSSWSWARRWRRGVAMVYLQVKLLWFGCQCAQIVVTYVIQYSRHPRMCKV